jgi:Rieske Fe-S protein
MSTKDGSGQLLMREVISYDDKDNHLSSARYNRDNVLTENYSFKYEFDDRGNWIKRHRTKTGTAKDGTRINEDTVEYRVVTYY